MPSYNSNQDVIDYIKSLEDRLQKLEKANPLNNGTIDDGGIVVKSGGDIIVENGGKIIDGDPNDSRVVLGVDAFGAPALLVYLGTVLGGQLSSAQFGSINAAGNGFIGVHASPGSFNGLDISDAQGIEPAHAQLNVNGVGSIIDIDSDGLINIQSSTGETRLSGFTVLNLFAQIGPVNILADGDVTLESNGGGLVRSLTSYGSTTGNAANMFISSGGAFQRSTSSLKYKQDVEDVELDIDAILQLQPRTWRDKNEVKEDPNTAERYIGFIAEEVDALGLKEFVVYDEDGKPDALQYDRFSVALIAVIQQMYQDIQDLKRNQ